MKNIVKIENGELVVTLKDVAKFSGVQYESTQRMVRDSRSEFLELGLRLPKESDFKSVRLDEYQASFLITLLKNTPIVKRFKLDLMLQFKRLKDMVCKTNKLLLSQKETQLQIAQKTIQELKVKRMKTYRDGFMSLRRYLQLNKIRLNEDMAWDMLLDKNYVAHKEVSYKRIILMDETLGRQEDTGVIEFNSRALDDVFEDYIYREPTLFDGQVG